MSTPGVDFVLNNLQTTLNGANGVVNAPFVVAIERQSALTMAGRQPGQPNYHGTTAAAANSIVLIDDISTSCAQLGYAKNAGLMCVLNATVNCTVSLFALTQNTTTLTCNTASLATDSAFTSFNAYNLITITNLSGVLDSTSNTLTVNVGASNGATLPVAAANTLTLQAGGGAMVIAVPGNGITVNATKTNITFAGNGQMFSIAVSGS